jgi:hypothetical protein
MRQKLALHLTLLTAVLAVALAFAFAVVRNGWP